eukprot:334155-Chlamydomonas_euryale.AAC.4
MPARNPDPSAGPQTHSRRACLPTPMLAARTATAGARSARCSAPRLASLASLTGSRTGCTTLPASGRRSMLIDTCSALAAAPPRWRRDVIAELGPKVARELRIAGLLPSEAGGSDPGAPAPPATPTTPYARCTQCLLRKYARRWFGDEASGAGGRGVETEGRQRA